MASETNNYCLRLNLPVPRLEDFVGRRDLKLFDLMVVALLEHGAPLPVETLAAHVVAAGVESETGDMAYSLKKAWHGMEPVFRDSEGRFGLNFSAPELNRRLFHLGLKGRGIVQPCCAAEPSLASVPAPIPDDVPLTEAEVRWAFAQSYLSNVSPLRQVAAVLDAVGKPMSVVDVEAYLLNLTPHRHPLREETISGWRKPYMHRDAEGRLWLDRAAPEVPAMRRAVRKLAAPGREQELRKEQWARNREVLAQEQERSRQAAAGLRRVLLRVVPDKGPVAAAAMLDIGSRAIRTFVGDELAELRAELGAFDLAAALWVRDTLHALGVLDVDRFRLVDLKPPRKTRQLNRRGRTLAITPELLITSTTGISQPLGDPAKIAAYLASGDFAKLRRRLESDVKALFAFYQYGVSHGSLRLRWGFLDETCPSNGPSGAIQASTRRSKHSGQAVSLWRSSRARHQVGPSPGHAPAASPSWPSSPGR